MRIVWNQHPTMNPIHPSPAIDLAPTSVPSRGLVLRKRERADATLDGLVTTVRKNPSSPAIKAKWEIPTLPWILSPLPTPTSLNTIVTIEITNPLLPPAMKSPMPVWCTCTKNVPLPEVPPAAATTTNYL